MAGILPGAVAASQRVAPPLPPLVAHKRWGISLMACRADVFGIAGLTMAATPGGADLTQSRLTAIASTTNPGAGAVTTLFDGNLTTAWGTTNSSMETVEVVWTDPVSIGAVGVTARQGTFVAQAPAAYVVWGRDEATDVRIAYRIVTGLPVWGISETREAVVGNVPIPDDLAHAQIWMIDFTQTNGALCIVSEMEFAAVLGGPNIATGGASGGSTTFNSAYHGMNLTDGTTAEWAAQNGQAFGKALYVFAGATLPVQYALTSRASGGGDAPRAWSVLRGVNGIDFTPIAGSEVVNQTAWAANQRRLFNLP